MQILAYSLQEAPRSGVPQLLRLSRVCTLIPAPEKGTCKVLGDAGEVLVQELLQRLGLGGGGQALDELQVN